MLDNAQLEPTHSDLGENYFPKHGDGLSFIWLELTSRCNLECVHCYANSSPHQPLSEGMTRDDWRETLDHAASLIYYLVPDIALAHMTLRGRGVEFITEPHLVHRAPDYELWLADFRDSEGNVLALMDRKRPS